jgi:hypothetical protein
MCVQGAEGGGVMSIRFETWGNIGKVGVLVIMVLCLRPWETHQLVTPMVPPCQDENAIIDHWTGMNLIRRTQQSGKNLDFFVYDKAWAALARSTQVVIGKAAYCQVALAGKGGVARIDDLNGNELARVADGRWISWQFPE